MTIDLSTLSTAALLSAYHFLVVVNGADEVLQRTLHAELKRRKVVGQGQPGEVLLDPETKSILWWEFVEEVQQTDCKSMEEQAIESWFGIPSPFAAAVRPHSVERPAGVPALPEQE